VSEAALVSIVVPVFNEAANIVACLDKLTIQDYAAIEIIVVDDASRDASRSLVAAYPDSRVRLLGNTRNRGPAYCLNKGAEVALGEILMFVDADCVVPEHWVSTACESLTRHDAVAVEAAIHYAHQQKEIWQKIPLNPFYNLSGSSELTVPCRDFANGNFAVYRHAFRALGGFRVDRYPNGREDTDLGLRLSGLGTVVYSRDMSVIHTAGNWTLAGLLRNARRYAADVRLYKDHGEFSFLKGRVLHPRFLFILLLPPLVFFYFKIRNIHDLSFLPKLLVYFLVLRIIIWREAIHERVVLL